MKTQKRKNACLSLMLCALTLTGCTGGGERGFRALRKAFSGESTADSSEASPMQVPEEEPEVSGLDDGTLTQTVDGVTYRYHIDDDVAVLEDISVSSHVDMLEIPEWLQGGPVNRIPEYGLSGATGFTGVSIPPLLRTMDAYAFSDCKELKHVAMEDAYLTMDEYCFDGSALETVYINGSADMNNYCFYQMPQLKTVLLSGGQSVLGEYCFRKCANLEEIYINAGTFDIGSYCFSSTSAEQAVICCQGVIGEYCFIENPNLKTVLIGEGLTSMKGDCFSGCPQLETVVLPKSLLNIGEGCFSGCPNAVIRAPEGSFAQVYAEKHGLRFEAEEPTALAAQIPDPPFVPGSTLLSRRVTGSVSPDGSTSEAQHSEIDRMFDSEFLFIDKPAVIPDGSCHGLSELKYMSIDADIRIGKDCFVDCPTVENIKFSDGNVQIGDGSFHKVTMETLDFIGCTGTIGNECVNACLFLSEVCLEEGMTEIGDSCFTDCPLLYDVYLPASLKKIGKDCFLNCPDITLYAPAGSYALQYAKEHDLPCDVLDWMD